MKLKNDSKENLFGRIKNFFRDVMKIQLVKKTEETGEVWYYIYADDRCVIATQDEDKARSRYQLIKETGGKITEEILLSDEI